MIEILTKRQIGALIAGLAATIAAVSVHGQVVLVDNIDNSLDYVTFPGAGQGEAEGFTTTPGTPLTLDSIYVRMGSTGPSNGGIFSLSLYSDAGGQPGSSLGQLTGPFNPSASFGQQSAVSVYYNLPAALAPETTYWVVATSSAGFYEWWATVDPTNVGTAQLTGGMSNTGSGWVAETGLFHVMAVVATPEPEDWGLAAGLAAAGLAILIKRPFRPQKAKAA